MILFLNFLNTQADLIYKPKQKCFSLSESSIEIISKSYLYQNTVVLKFDKDFSELNYNCSLSLSGDLLIIMPKVETLLDNSFNLSKFNEIIKNSNTDSLIIFRVKGFNYITNLSKAVDPFSKKNSFYSMISLEYSHLQFYVKANF